jgi:hypothetical protein
MVPAHASSSPVILFGCTAATALTTTFLGAHANVVMVIVLLQGPEQLIAATMHLGAQQRQLCQLCWMHMPMCVMVMVFTVLLQGPATHYSNHA